MNSHPFDLATNLDYLFSSREHGRVFQAILRAIERGEGLMSVTGEPGTGKSLLCERLAAELNGSLHPVYFPLPPDGPQGMTEAIDAEVKGRENKTPVILIDEAQGLSDECLDHIKALWNLRRDDGSLLLHVVLVGQPELRERLSLPKFRPLAQRVGVAVELRRLKRSEIFAYLTYRLTKGGLGGKMRFTRGAASRLYGLSGGIPRLVNRYANAALKRAAEKGRSKISAFDVFAASRGLPRERVGRARGFLAAGLLAFAAASAVAAFLPDTFLQMSYVSQVPSVKTLPSKPAPRFVVSAGRYLVKEQAERIAQDLLAAGYKAVVQEQTLPDGWTLYGVLLADPVEHSEALRVVESLKSKPGFAPVMGEVGK